MPMKNPPHPGSLVLHDCIEPLGLTITDAADALGVSRFTLSELVNGKRGISPEMAVRLSKAFGGSAESWLTSKGTTILPSYEPTASRFGGCNQPSRELQIAPARRMCGSMPVIALFRYSIIGANSGVATLARAVTGLENFSAPSSTGCHFN